ncbi:MAG: hypothetical protein ACXVEF_19255 [Polyangiales bacterium]
MAVPSVAPPSSRRSRPPFSLARARAEMHADEGATTMAIQLAVLRASFRLDVVALVAVDGTLIASAGDVAAAEELAPFAAAAAREPRGRRGEVLPRLGVIVEVVEHAGRSWVFAATTTDPKRDVRAIVNALGEVLPDIAAAAALDDDDDDGFEAALDQAFDGEDDDWFGLAVAVG